MAAKLQTVHVRVDAAATRQPTPVRIRFTQGEQYYSPLGRLREFSLGENEDVGGNVQVEGRKWCFIDGACEIDLPPGLTTIEIAKGFEYQPVRQELFLGPGRLSLRLKIERWADLRASRWFSGDVRCHFLTPHAALLEAAAEDLAVVNLLIVPWYGRDEAASMAIPNVMAFSGQQPALQRAGHMVAVNSLNVADESVKLALLNCHRLVYPLSFGGKHSLIDWTLADWCGQCHRKGGLVIWSDCEYLDWLEHDNPVAGEALADVVLGKIDALEVDNVEWCNQGLADWYALLGAGFRIPLTGASGKASNSALLGQVRTYARLAQDQELSYGHWIEAVRAGRTFVTNGPLLQVTINGQGPGSVVELPAGAATIQVRAEVHSLAPVERLELVQDGEVVADRRATGDPATGLLEEEFQVRASGWWAVRCWGRQTANTVCGAHSSAIHVQMEGQSPPTLVKNLEVLRRRVQYLSTRLSHEIRFASDRDRQRLAAVYESAIRLLDQRAGLFQSTQ